MKKEINDCENHNNDVIAPLPYVKMLIPERDGGYRGEILELSGCYSEGDTELEVLSNLENAAVDWLQAAKELGQRIPAPVDLANEFSGKLMLRISKGLHKRASLLADLEGVSLNQFISNCLAEAIGEKCHSKNVADSRSVASYNSYNLVNIVVGTTREADKANVSIFSDNSIYGIGNFANSVAIPFISNPNGLPYHIKS